MHCKTSDKLGPVPQEFFDNYLKYQGVCVACMVCYVNSPSTYLYVGLVDHLFITEYIKIYIPFIYESVPVILEI